MIYINTNRLSFQHKMYKRRKLNNYNKDSTNQKINSQHPSIEKGLGTKHETDMENNKI